MAEDHCAPWVKVVMMIILTLYMYGAMCTKYVSGAESFVEAISFTFYNDKCAWEERISIDPYYIGIIVFGVLSLIFCFGNIENAKTLQIVISILRFIAILLMYSGSFFYLHKYGANPAPVFDWSQ